MGAKLTLQEIWNTPLSQIQDILKTDDNTDEIQNYINASVMSIKNLSRQEQEIVTDPLFEKAMRKVSVDTPQDRRLDLGLQIYNEMKANQNIEKEIIKERNPKCKYNDFDENNDPIDPITYQTFDESKNYILNDRCYDADSIRMLLTTSNKDPYTREDIPKSVYDDLGVEYPDTSNTSRTLDLSNQNITNEQLLNIQFHRNIKILDLSNNQITSLENVIFPTNLEILDLQNNQITSLQNVIFPTNIMKLLIENNQITSLQNVIFPTNLKFLYLENNQITSLENVIFPENLKSLELQYNQITSLENINFPRQLETIKLANNRIKIIKDITFPESLIYLNLSYNNIEFIENVRIPVSLLNSYFNIYGNPLINNELFTTY